MLNPGALLRHIEYQAWYRDSGNICGHATCSISNGMIVVWAQ
jgi:hypothetical protein